jgi:pyruvate/2-oxoglutarate dehydrogenase complex dihydrolipoamide dehydrogenase (E3) component
VLAAGSRPRIPDIRGLEEVGFLTNETIFDCDTLPESLLVIGGGPIGTELGQAFSRLGSRVTIASSSNHILPREDADIAEVLARQLRQEGISIWGARTSSGQHARMGRSSLVSRPPRASAA